MTGDPGFRFVVEEVFRLPSRPYVLALGTIESGVVRVGDQVEAHTADGQRFAGVVEAIEFHSPQGKHTIGVGGPAADRLAHGVVVSSV